MRNFDLRNALYVFKKELLDTFRDREVIFTILVMPLVIYPIIAVVIMESSTLVTSRWSDEGYRMGVLETQKEFFASFKGDKTYVPVVISESDTKSFVALDKIDNEVEKLKDSITTDCKKDQLKECRDKNNEISNGIKAKDKAAEPYRKHFRDLLVEKEVDFIVFKEDKKEQSVIHYVANDSIRKSQRALKYFKKRVMNKSKTLLDGRLKKLNITRDYFTPLKNSVTDVASKAMGIATSVGSGIGAYILFLFVLSMIYPACNTVFDEKENKTLRVLLLSPLSSLELVLGKLFSVALFGLIGFMPYVVLGAGFIAFFVYKFQRYEVLEMVNISNPFLLIFGLLSVVLLLASTMLFVSTLAKTKKAAQSFLSIFMMCVLFPAYILNIFDLKLELTNAFIPFFSSIVFFKGTVAGNLNFPEIFVFFLFNTLFTIMVLALILKSFDFRGQLENRSSDLLKLLSRKSRKEVGLSPTLSFVSSIICILWIALYSQSVDATNVSALSLAKTILINIGAPLLFVIAYFRPSFKKSFPISGKVVSGSLIAIPLVLIAQPLLIWVLNHMVPSEYMSMFDDAFGTVDEHIVFRVIAIALIPAIIEELFFRGIVLQGFVKKFGNTFAVLFSAIFFAVAHWSLVRFIPTFCLGILLGTLVIRYRSLIPAMIFHFINNALAVTTQHFEWNYIDHLNQFHIIFAVIMIALFLWPKPLLVFKSFVTRRE